MRFPTGLLLALALTLPGFAGTKEETVKLRYAAQDFLIAYRDQNADKIWAAMSKDCQKRFTTTFNDVKKKTFSQETAVAYIYPPAGNCKTAQEYLRKLMETQPKSLPKRCEMLKMTLTDLEIRDMVKTADVMLSANRACVEFLDEHCVLNFVKEGENWKVDNAFEFDPLG